ncbi:MAG: hypothetical protein CMH56_10480 [Myxococcales bacterium]|nr:hypothetical protein [Myxococcales bacterium]
MALGVGLAWGCAHHQPPMDLSQLTPLKEGRAIEEAVVHEAMAHFPNDATLLAMEEGFALLRSEGDHDEVLQKKAHAFLEKAFYDFQSLQDPENLNLAFTADADVPYKGRPHERVLTATTLALLDALGGRCDLALPTLRAAEFLDARWQPFPYGTDAPLVYALMLFCSGQTTVADSDVQHAREGLYVSLRVKKVNPIFQDWLMDNQKKELRQNAMAPKLAYWLWEQAAPGALLQYPNERTASELVSLMSRDALRLVKRADAFLEKEENQASLERLAGIAFSGWGKEEKMRQLVMGQLADEIRKVEERLLTDLTQKGSLAESFRHGLEETHTEFESVQATIDAGVLSFAFSGFGPAIELEGTYQEIAHVVPNQNEPVRLESPALDCNHSATSQGVFHLRLCATNTLAQAGQLAPEPPLSLWSSSYQATTVVGRQFDRILKGRAEFKTGAADVSEKAVESSFFFFDLGTRGLLECIGKTNEDAATAACFVLAGIALSVSLISAGVAGAAYVAGAMVNAAADHRYVHSLYEGVFLCPTPPQLATAKSL